MFGWFNKMVDSYNECEDRFKKWVDTSIEEEEKEEGWYYAEDYEDKNNDEDDDLEDGDDE